MTATLAAAHAHVDAAAPSGAALAPTPATSLLLSALTGPALVVLRESIRTAILTAPTWRLQTHWLGREWGRMLTIEAEMRRRGTLAGPTVQPRPGWP